MIEAVASPVTSAIPGKPSPARLMSLDVYRGVTMLMMASAGLHLGEVAKNHFSGSPAWQFLAEQTDHVKWAGCSLWDLIQPSFMFMVGVSLPYSLASRREKGDTFAALFCHAVFRSFLLVALSCFLVSQWSKQTSFIFTNVLAQIGLGYPLLFLLAWTRPRTQIAAAVAILAGYWALFALYPHPPADFDYSSVGLPKDWNYLQGFAAHWQKNANAAYAFDRWFLNIFPREAPWNFSTGGYQTLNFIPSLATMIFGLLAGQILRSDRPVSTKIMLLICAGIGGLVLGGVLNVLGICPIVKRIWTPSWALFSGGWTFLILASFYVAIDVKGFKGWTFPFIVVGMNSIAMYVMEQASSSYIRGSLKIHLGQKVFEKCDHYGPIVECAAVLLVMWLVCLWMYRRKLFLKL